MCGSENAADALVCGICGYHLREHGVSNSGGQKCARCGSAVPAGYDFCPVCGLDQRLRFARPHTQVVSIDAEEPGLPSSTAATAPAPAGRPAAPVGEPPAQTGRTVFVDGPPLARPFEHAPTGLDDQETNPRGTRGRPPGDDDMTLPAPSRHLPRAEGPAALFDTGVPVVAGLRPAEERTVTVRGEDGPLGQAPPTLPGQNTVEEAYAAYPGPPPVAPAPGSPYVGQPAPSLQPPAWAPVPPSRVSTTPGQQPARLVVVGRDGVEGQSFPILGDHLSLGRTHGEVVFPDDAFMSPAHARVERVGDGFVLVDTGSINGIFLRINGVSAVYPGDLFMIGHQLLRLDTVSEAVTEQAPDAEGTRLFGTPLKPAWGKLVLVGRGGVAGDQYYLRRAKVVLGRESGDVVFPADPFASREHAQLRLEIKGSTMAVYLEDLGSANGTYIRVRGSCPLRPRDTFRIGDQILRLRLGS